MVSSSPLNSERVLKLTSYTTHPGTKHCCTIAGLLMLEDGCNESRYDQNLS